MAVGQALPVRFPCWCKAVYSWGGETKRDLGFIEGDLIEVLNAGDGSWWMGRLKRDRRMVGLFPSNFVELLSEDYQPWARHGSGGSISRQNSAQEQAKPAPQKSKSMFRKPFTAYAAAGAPNPAAAARERLKAGGLSSPNGSVKTKSPYSSMKRSSTESRESPSPAPPSRAPSNLRAVSPRPASARPPIARAASPAPPSQHASHGRALSPAPPAEYQYHTRAVSPAPPSRHGSDIRAHSPAPPAHYQYQPREVSPAPSSRQGSYIRAHSPAPVDDYRYQSRAVSPVPPAQHNNYARAISPAPPLRSHDQYRAVSPAPPVHYEQHSRAVSPAPSFQYRAYDRGPSPVPSFQQPSRAPSPAPSFQYRAYDRGPSPSPYQHQLDYSRSPSPAPYHEQFEETIDSPPPPPPPHRVAYNPSRGPSPAPASHNGYQTPEPPSPDPRAHGGHFTPSPLTSAMNDVMSSLQDMTMSKSNESPEEPPTPSNPWSPEAFDQVYQASAKKVRAQSALGMDDEDDGDAPLDVNNYVQRMESRLRRMQQQEKAKSNELYMDQDQGPPVPLKNSFKPAPSSSSGDVEPEVERKGSRLLRHRKSAYDIGRNALGRTFTSKTNSTTTTHTSNSTNRSLMSGHSATNMSATSAGSYYRKKFGIERPKSVMNTKDTTGKGYGFDDGRPETPFTGVTYHSSHASQSRPASSDQQEGGASTPATDGPDPLGGLSQPKAKRSGFFRKMIDTAKTQAANARSTIDTISRPGSRAASRVAGRAASRAASRLDNAEPTGIEGGAASHTTNTSRDMGLGTVDWVQVRRDVNRSNSLSKNERAERAERCQMMDMPVLNPIDILFESAEGDEGLDGLPITEPTDFAACSLTHVDKSARFINSIPLGTNPATLAQGYVCRPYRSDIQRLRAIFTWVSERISWEEDFEGEMDPRHVLQSKRGCSQEIAMVVAEMCASVGLHAEVVRGYLKTPGEPLDLESVARPNHHWNTVIVEGEWRIMDCSLAGPTNPKRVHFSTAGSSVAESWYFLARPMEICYSHVPLLPEQQHICPPQPHEVLMALPCATPAYFKHGLNMTSFDTSLLNLDNLEMAHVYIDVPEDVECVAEVEARSYSQDMDGDFFESGEFVRKPALAQAEWYGGQKRYTVKALLPGDEGHGILKIYAGPRGLMHSNKMNPHSLAIGLPMTHTGTNPPYSFLTLHPTPHAQRHDLYVAQPQCANLALNNTFVFCVRQHPSSLTKSPEPSPAMHGRASPNPFARPASAMSMQSISATGSNYTNPSQASSGSSGSNNSKPAKLAVQTPSGKIIRLTRKNEHMTSTNEADGTAWETVIKIGEKGTWRGLVLADRSARWCVFAQWECA
ncbi:cytokinesis protein Cyk3 [Decorospora gaudefroyi]|uniref:Cytokinesis protein Cyk3 n=1 Tax=Decorospora gaudefroyi TaxID=184978 RepID=A0A6A5K807_9PLEO|nr:cytokinesis protein Cyk3 [Decorospora gaudefroyi]